MLRDLRARYPNATMTVRVSIPITEAAGALQRNDARRALTVLEPVEPYDRTSRAGFWSEYLRGEAYLRLKDGDNAAAQFKSILKHRGEDPLSSVYPLAQLGLARAQIMAGDSANARQSYQAFINGWVNADEGIAPLVQAREELARLK